MVVSFQPRRKSLPPAWVTAPLRTTTADGPTPSVPHESTSSTGTGLKSGHPQLTTCHSDCQTQPPESQGELGAASRNQITLQEPKTGRLLREILQEISRDNKRYSQLTFNLNALPIQGIPNGLRECDIRVSFHFSGTICRCLATASSVPETELF